MKFLWLVAFLGILDSLYLSYSKYTASPLTCGIIKGCNLVASSAYSTLFGIPLAYLGLFYYVFIFVVIGFLIKSFSTFVYKLFVFSSFFGATLSVYFLYLQAFKIQAFCTYCIFSAIFSFLLFIGAFFIRKQEKVLHEN